MLRHNNLTHLNLCFLHWFCSNSAISTGFAMVYNDCDGNGSDGGYGVMMVIAAAMVMEMMMGW